ncbi:testicular acid phosphatase homolog [Trichonephila inaurata madagascariensis]|uniref:acid phosphatase n=1 Tax=Trichonephila inaurata madagascariensis TaxID=2747483 RepID=A0A8X6Y6E0_9ARAC|nr:testicular acid phosphatase homolog [Trichonephila inaurata madagascariensis]
MNCLFWIILAILSSGASSLFEDDEKELIFLQLVFRNGFSAPQQLYPTDPNNPNRWEEGLGELTLEGRKQMFALGKELRKRYDHFITGNPREITVQAAVHPKNKRSGLSLLASLYAPTEFWEFIPGLPWQPVPIFYIGAKQDKVLSPLRTCPGVVSRMEELVDLYGTGTVLDMYKQQLKFWSLNSGIPIQNWNDVVSLYRILYAEKAYNYTIPSWARKYWTEMECLNDYAYKVNFNDPKILKVVGGPILWHLVNSANDKVKGDFEHTKVMAYSGQSSHVAGLLGALKCFNNKEPPFGSIVIMELFKHKKNDQHSIRLLFTNGTTDLQVLRYSGCQEFCPLHYLSNKTKHWENPKWGRDCFGESPLDQLRELLAGIQI